MSSSRIRERLRNLQREMSWFLPQLWIGSDRFPFPSGDVPYRESLGLWDGIHATRFQIAGLFCHHANFFGIVFKLPENDPLARLGESYSGSCIPGIANPDAAPSLDDVIQLRERLRELGLNVDPRRYYRFAEAHLPLEPELAWHYAVARKLKVIVFRHHQEAEFWAPSELDIHGYSEVVEYLEAAWEAACRQIRSPTAPPHSWNAVAVVGNSD